VVASVVDHSEYGHPRSLEDVEGTMTPEEYLSEHPDPEWDSGHIERLTVAFESIAESLFTIATLREREYDMKYPQKKGPSEPTITYIPTDEERLKEEQGQTGERTTEDWTSLGPRERAFVKKEKSNK